MSDDSKNLLDQMLEETSQQEKKASRNLMTAAVADQEDPKAETQGWPHDCEQFMELTSVDLRALIGAVAPNDLLVVVAEASEGLRACILGQLDPESVEWMNGNLKLWDPATDDLRESSRAKVLDVAKRLVKEGKITIPGSLERVEQSQDTAGDDERSGLVETLLGLVTLADVEGREGLEAVANETQHPMLQFGIKALLELDELEDIDKELAERQRALEEAYRNELELIRQALIAIARGDRPESFLARAKAAVGE